MLTFFVFYQQLLFHSLVMVGSISHILLHNTITRLSKADFWRVSPRVCDLSHVWGHGHQNLRAVPEHVSLQTASHQISLQIVPNQVSLQSTCTFQGSKKCYPSYDDTWKNQHWGKPYSCSGIASYKLKPQPIWRYINKSTLGKNLTAALVLLLKKKPSTPLKIHQRIHTWEKPYSCSGIATKKKLSTYLKINQRIHIWENLTVALVVFTTNITLNPFEDTSKNPHLGKTLQLLWWCFLQA